MSTSGNIVITGNTFINPPAPPPVIPVLGASEGTLINPVNKFVTLGSPQDAVVDASTFTRDRFLMLDGFILHITADQTLFPAAGGLSCDFQFDPVLGIIKIVADNTVFGSTFLEFLDTNTGNNFIMDYNGQTIVMTNNSISGNQLIQMGAGSTVFNNNSSYAGHVYDMVGNGLRRKRLVDPITANVTTSADNDSDTLWTNEGAGALVSVIMATVATGDIRRLYCDNVNGIKITAPAGVTLQFAATVTAPGGSVTSITVGSAITFEAISPTKLVATSIVGVWV